MTNSEAVKGLCNAICNTFYPDNQAVDVMLFNEGVTGSTTATAKDPTLLKIAIRLVTGYVEGSHSEGGVSVSVGRDRINENIAHWCADYGLDADEYIIAKSVDDGTKLW